MSWLVLVCGIFLFFYGIYRSTQVDNLQSIPWSLMSVVGLALVGGAILFRMVPGFFAGVF